LAHRRSAHLSKRHPGGAPWPKTTWLRETVEVRVASALVPAAQRAWTCGLCLAGLAAPMMKCQHERSVKAHMEQAHPGVTGREAYLKRRRDDPSLCTSGTATVKAMADRQLAKLGTRKAAGHQLLHVELKWPPKEGLARPRQERVVTCRLCQRICQQNRMVAVQCARQASAPNGKRRVLWESLRKHDRRNCERLADAWGTTVAAYDKMLGVSGWRRNLCEDGDIEPNPGPEAGRRTVCLSLPEMPSSCAIWPACALGRAARASGSGGGWLHDLCKDGDIEPNPGPRRRRTARGQDMREVRAWCVNVASAATAFATVEMADKEGIDVLALQEVRFSVPAKEAFIRTAAKAGWQCWVQPGEAGADGRSQGGVAVLVRRERPARLHHAVSTPGGQALIVLVHGIAVGTVYVRPRSDDREKAHAAILESIAALGPRAPWVLCGDWNQTPAECGAARALEHFGAEIVVHGAKGQGDEPPTRWGGSGSPGGRRRRRVVASMGAGPTRLLAASSTPWPRVRARRRPTSLWPSTLRSRSWRSGPSSTWACRVLWPAGCAASGRSSAGPSSSPGRCIRGGTRSAAACRRGILGRHSP
jgi:hypothetical protein